MLITRRCGDVDAVDYNSLLKVITAVFNLLSSRAKYPSIVIINYLLMITRSVASSAH